VSVSNHWLSESLQFGYNMAKMRWCYISGYVQQPCAWRFCEILHKQYSVAIKYHAWMSTVIATNVLRFFRKILYNKQHVIHTYLPERSHIVYTMRTRQHNKNLITKTSDLTDRHFLIRLRLLLGYSSIAQSSSIIIPHSIFHCVISMHTVLCPSCVCQLLLKNFMMMMMNGSQCNVTL